MWHNTTLFETSELFQAESCGIQSLSRWLRGSLMDDESVPVGAVCDFARRRAQQVLPSPVAMATQHDQVHVEVPSGLEDHFRRLPDRHDWRRG